MGGVMAHRALPAITPADLSAGRAPDLPVRARRGLTTLAGLFALGLVASGCAREMSPPRAEEAEHPTPPYTDRELADALVRQGVGVARDAPTATPGPGETLPTEIRQTPRGVVVTFRDLLFAFDSAELTPVARGQIDRMAFVLNHPQAMNRRVVLEGHADAIGSDTYNVDLSKRRAEAVAQELIARGVKRDRLTVEALGKRRPIAPNTLPDGRDNPAGRALNRRVEAVVERLPAASGSAPGSTPAARPPSSPPAGAPAAPSK